MHHWKASDASTTGRRDVTRPAPAYHHQVELAGHASQRAHGPKVGRCPWPRDNTWTRVYGGSLPAVRPGRRVMELRVPFELDGDHNAGCEKGKSPPTVDAEVLRRKRN